MAAQVVPHALHRTGDGEGATAGEGVAGVGREVAHLAGGHVQPGGAGLQRAQHDAVAGQDDAAQEAAGRIDRLDRHRGTDHDHDARPGRPLLQQALARADHRNPAVGTQAGRVVVAVAQTRLRRAGHHPLGRHVPLFELFLDPPLHSVARHDAAQHPGGCGQAAPVALGQFLDVLQELCTMRQQAPSHTGGVVQRPFQSRVANIQRQ